MLQIYLPSISEFIPKCFDMEVKRGLKICCVVRASQKTLRTPCSGNGLALCIFMYSTNQLCLQRKTQKNQVSYFVSVYVLKETFIFHDYFQISRTNTSLVHSIKASISGSWNLGNIPRSHLFVIPLVQSEKLTGGKMQFSPRRYISLTPSEADRSTWEMQLNVLLWQFHIREISKQLADWHADWNSQKATQGYVHSCIDTYEYMRQASDSALHVQACKYAWQEGQNERSPFNTTCLHRLCCTMQANFNVIGFVAMSALQRLSTPVSNTFRYGYRKKAKDFWLCS